MQEPTSPRPDKVAFRPGKFSCFRISLSFDVAGIPGLTQVTITTLEFGISSQSGQLSESLLLPSSVSGPNMECVCNRVGPHYLSQHLEIFMSWGLIALLVLLSELHLFYFYYTFLHGRVVILPCDESATCAWRTLPSSRGSWKRLQQTPVTLVAGGSGC